MARVRWPGLGQRGNPSRPEPEAVRVAKVAVLEAIEEFEAGDSFEPVGHLRDAHDGDRFGEIESRYSDLDQIHVEPTRVGTAELNLAQECVVGGPFTVRFAQEQ